MSDSIDELIVRLEAATEGSRSLDGLIWKTIEPEGEWWEFEDGWGRRDPDDGAYVMAAPYTTSLETALTLVPEGACWQINKAEREYRAEVDFGDGVWASSPALAICIAALKVSAKDASTTDLGNTRR